MSKEDVKKIGEDAGIPIVHMAWPEGSAPPLPWATFYLSSQSGVNADNVVYAKASKWVLEVYQRSSDEELEKKVEQSIVTRFGPYTKSEYWVDTESAIQTTYYFREIGD